MLERITTSVLLNQLVGYYGIAGYVFIFLSEQVMVKDKDNS